MRFPVEGMTMFRIGFSDGLPDVVDLEALGNGVEFKDGALLHAFEDGLHVSTLDRPGKDTVAGLSAHATFSSTTSY